MSNLMLENFRRFLFGLSLDVPAFKARVLTSDFKGSQLDAFSTSAIVHCYLEFKLSYLKNLKLFSIRVK